MAGRSGERKDNLLVTRRWRWQPCPSRGAGSIPHSLSWHEMLRDSLPALKKQAPSLHGHQKKTSGGRRRRHRPLTVTLIICLPIEAPCWPPSPPPHRPLKDAVSFSSPQDKTDTMFYIKRSVTCRLKGNKK